MRAYLIATLTLFTLTEAAYGETYIGYPLAEPSNGLEFSDNIRSSTETSDYFLILFAHHAAYYRFPKQPGTSEVVKRFFDTSKTNRSVISVLVDGTNAQISKIGVTLK